MKHPSIIDSIIRRRTFYEPCYRIRELNGLVDGDQVAAALDDFELGILYPGNHLALVLLNRVDPVEFASEDQRGDADLRYLGRDVFQD